MSELCPTCGKPITDAIGRVVPEHPVAARIRELEQQLEQVRGEKSWTESPAIAETTPVCKHKQLTRLPHRSDLTCIHCGEHFHDLQKPRGATINA